MTSKVPPKSELTLLSFFIYVDLDEEEGYL